MSWFWGSSKQTNDATSQLDAGLRDYLNKETSRQAADAKTQSSSRSPTTSETTYRAQTKLETPSVSHSHQVQDVEVQSKPIVPPESQFQDGRYAHLWKTYRSQEEIAAASYTDQDKLTAVLETFKDRKAAIGRAAIENCIVEQMEQQECFTSGSWSRLATMCRTESMAFNRCYEMQSRFLKALGYLSVVRSAEEEERIQMHADKLYQDMLEREKQIKEAQEKGAKLPVKPLIDASAAVKALGEDSAYSRMRKDALIRNEQAPLQEMSPEVQARIKAALKDMTEEERALELQLLVAEDRANRDLATRMKTYYDEEREARKSRREQGKETIGDKMKRYGGWAE